LPSLLVLHSQPFQPLCRGNAGKLLYQESIDVDLGLFNGLTGSIHLKPSFAMSKFVGPFLGINLRKNKGQLGSAKGDADLYTPFLASDDSTDRGVDGNF